MASNNLRIYDQARSVPNEAKKLIGAGRLKGMTDVNPMYRIKRLTEMFGPCGIGWWYEITNKQIIDDQQTNQRAAFVDILLYYNDPETQQTSVGIPGTGGASFVSQERNGAYLSDECFKMALTDAISVAAKALGVAADVYWDKDRTKYSTYTSEPTAQDVGTAKLASLTEKINAATAPSEKKMATPVQISYILEHADDKTKLEAMKAFGADLQGMTFAQGNKLITRIKEANT